MKAPGVVPSAEGMAKSQSRLHSTPDLAFPYAMAIGLCIVYSSSERQRWEWRTQRSERKDMSDKGAMEQGLCSAKWPHE